jgi:serine-type D-Ala-D-Ala carboxypeptidase/endopeptidase (penicillin-binding protein 4)
MLCISNNAYALPDTAINNINAKLSNFVSRHKSRLGKNARIGISILEAETGRQIYSHNENETLIPASVIKVFTSVAALKLLGSEYKFNSEIFVDVPIHMNNGNVGGLYFRGQGDPGLTSERLWLLAENIKRAGVDHVSDIIIDDSLFVGASGPSGSRAYNAGSGAVSLNYNSYSINIIPQKVGERPTISLTQGLSYEIDNHVMTVSGNVNQIVIEESLLKENTVNINESSNYLKLPKRRVTIKGRIGIDRGAQTWYRTVGSASAYFGEVFKFMLESLAVNVRGVLKRGIVPDSAEHLYTFSSKPLKSYIHDLNHYSNNFIGEQIIFALGQNESRLFSRDVGILRMQDFFLKLSPKINDIKIVDGSGLDRGNRINAVTIAHVLHIAYQDFSVAPNFISSLSRFGYSGTLRKREINFRRTNGREGHDLSDKMPRNTDRATVWAKTGTLTGVNTLAGYATNNNSQSPRLAFAILINGHESNERASNFQEGLLTLVLELME